MTDWGTKLLPFPGDVEIPATDLAIPKARALALVVPRLPFVKVLSCRRDSARPRTEIVVIEVEVERGQTVVNDIRRNEVLAVEFDARDHVAPTVLALRTDFPRVPHLVLDRKEVPRTLCLYELPYSEVRLRWTPRSFVDWLREWLARTAENKLHSPDQPLEPLILQTAPRIILPNELLSARPDSAVFLKLVDVKGDHQVLYARKVDEKEQSAGPSVLVLSLEAKPHVHGIIERAPQTLEELHELLEKVGISLLDSLRVAIRNHFVDKPIGGILRAHLLILVALPKLRQPGKEPETIERCALICDKQMGAIGEAIGVLASDGSTAGYVMAPDLARRGKEIRVSVLQPHFSLSREAAARHSGSAQNSEQFCLVGVGALGSQIALNLVRAGFGKWTVIDGDVVLPHNLARHALVDFLGYPKADALAEFSTLIIDGEQVLNAVVADILTFPSSQNQDLEKALAGAKAIVDCSASLAVARHLVHEISVPARRVSLFLNPAGTDLVLLAESEGRETTLDQLEMQFYRMILRTPQLWNHLRTAVASVRYSVGCRDISAVISQDLVALNAAIGSRQIREALGSKHATISTWSLDPDSMETTRFSTGAEACSVFESNGWRISYDGALLRLLSMLRQAKLPTETGGVLLGTFDTSRKIVYAVDALPAPPDSVETPHSFVRGCKGLRAALEVAGNITHGHLEYVGEWHTHPRGFSSQASEDDKKLLDALSRLMADDGLPEVMLIVAGGGKHSWYLRDQTPA